MKIRRLINVLLDTLEKHGGGVEVTVKSDEEILLTPSTLATGHRLNLESENERIEE